MRSNLDFSNVMGLLIKNQLRMESMTIPSVADNTQIGVDWPTVIIADADGVAKDMLLPAEASSKDLVFLIINFGGENLVIKDDADSSTIGTVATATSGLFHCDGTTWRRVVL